MRLLLASLKRQQHSKRLLDLTPVRRIMMNGVVTVAHYLQGLKKIKKIKRLMLTTHKLIIILWVVVRKNVKKKLWN
jgi:hypothetical protein